MQSDYTQLVRILLVEDDPVHAKLVRRAMRGFEMIEVCHVEDGERAIEAATDPGDFQVDLILLDLRLPGRDGFDVLSAIRAGESTRSTPVVVVSTSDRVDEIARCYDLGANAYFCKPLAFDEMVAALRAMADFWLDMVAV